MANIVPYQTKRLALKSGWNGQKVVQISFKGKYDKADIKDYIQKFSDKKKKEGFKGEIEPVLRYNSGPRGWRAGIFTPVGERVLYYEDEYAELDLDEPEHFSEFLIMLLQT